MHVETNFLEETIRALEGNNKKPSDVLWIGDGANWITWEEFKMIGNFEYDSGFGSAIINDRLKVVGSDWWLERNEYDGNEWWEFKRLPEKPEKKIPLKTSDDVRQFILSEDENMMIEQLREEDEGE